MDIFEQASRLGLNFELPNIGGVWKADDLWALPFKAARGPCLYDLATALHNDLKHDTPDFLDDIETPDPKQKLRFDIVKHVIEVKKAENKALLEARARAEQKQKILGIMARKQDAALEGQSLEDLQALLATL
jgi:hypothetical protein